MAYLIVRKSLGWPEKHSRSFTEWPVGPRTSGGTGVKYHGKAPETGESEEDEEERSPFSVDLNFDRDVGTQLSGRDLLPAAPIDQSRKE